MKRETKSLLLTAWIAACTLAIGAILGYDMGQHLATKIVRDTVWLVQKPVTADVRTYEQKVEQAMRVYNRP